MNYYDYFLILVLLCLRFIQLFNWINDILYIDKKQFDYIFFGIFDKLQYINIRCLIIQSFMELVIVYSSEEKYVYF